MTADICAGERPSRPTDPNQNQLLQDAVWSVITSGWHDKPRRRCKLLAIYYTFSPTSEQQQRGKILPRVASFFQFLQDSEPEIQKRVNEINEVYFSTHPPTPG